MNVYFDIANFCSFAKSQSNKIFLPCIDMLRESCDLNFTFEKDDINKTKKEVRNAVAAVLKSFTHNRGTCQTNWNVKITHSPLEEECNAENLRSVYLLDVSELSVIRQGGALLIGGIGSELRVLSNLFIDGKHIPTKQFDIRTMEDWSTVKDNSSPCTDVIIVDPYLFAQPDFLYGINAYDLIKALCSHALGTIINVVIFTNENYKDGNTSSEISFTTILRQLREKISKETNAELALTIVKLPAHREHDRMILTNYKLFVSGDSFKYFGYSGEKNNVSSRGRWMTISSLVDSEKYRQSKDVIADLQKIVDDVKQRLNSIVGDRKCSFLNFSDEV